MCTNISNSPQGASSNVKTLEVDAMHNDDRNQPDDNADEPLPAAPSEDETEADEQQRKVDEIERKVADGH